MVLGKGFAGGQGAIEGGRTSGRLERLVRGRGRFPPRVASCSRRYASAFIIRCVRRRTRVRYGIWDGLTCRIQSIQRFSPDVFRIERRQVSA